MLCLLFSVTDASWQVSSCRLGEASNPGPEHCVSFGTSNPSGLRNKERLAAELGPGIWQFAETQLQWLHESFHTGRIQALHHVVGDTPVLTANLYGYPSGKTFADARVRTEHLLETLTHEFVLGRKGVRLICGDFNHFHDDLEQVQLWKQHGWIEAQELALLRWQQLPTPTCKGATHRDFVFLSPEAASLCESVTVRDIFAEHSTVIASLRVAGAPRLHAWPLPAEIPWQSIDVPAWHQKCATIQIPESCSTRWLRAFAHGYERSLNGFVTAAPGSQLPQRRLSPDTPPCVTPPRPARQGRRPCIMICYRWR